jgi:hypothetical protein
MTAIGSLAMRQSSTDLVVPNSPILLSLPCGRFRDASTPSRIAGWFDGQWYTDRLRRSGLYDGNKRPAIGAQPFVH